MMPETAPKTRVSPEARLTQLREWLISGYSPAEALAQALKTWNVRERQLRADIDGILDAWVAEDAGQDPRRDFALCKRQRDRLIAMTARQLDACWDSRPEAACFLKLMDSMMKQREKLAKQMAELPRRLAKRPHEPRPDVPAEPPGGMPQSAFAPPTPEEVELDLEHRFQEATDYVRGLVKNLPPGELEASMAGLPNKDEVLQILRSEGPVERPQTADQAPPKAPPQAPRKHTTSTPKAARPPKPWTAQVDEAPKNTFHVPLSITAITGENRDVKNEPKPMVAGGTPPTSPAPAPPSR